MKRSKFSEEQGVYVLRQAENGTLVRDLCRQYGIAEHAFYEWKRKYAHLGVSELRRLRQVEEEDSRVQRLVADLSFDKHMLSEALRKKAKPARRRELAQRFHGTFQVSCAWACRLAQFGAHLGMGRVRPRIRRPCACAFAIWLMPDHGSAMCASGSCSGARAGRSIGNASDG